MNSGQSEEMPLLEHLVELRSRLLRVILGIAAVALLLSPFANPLYSTLAAPLMSLLPENSSMIATEVASPFLAPFKLVLFLGFFISAPWTAWQLWAFIAPGLYQQEKRFALPMLVASICLFYLGAAFAYFVVFPLVFGFFTQTAPEGVQVMTDINQYLNFVLILFLAFGLAFQLPVITLVLIKTGVTTVEALKEKRPYIIVGCFVVGMFLTPPDVISQTLLAIPMWLLFETGVILGTLVRPEQNEA